jgi:murein DD-endopeptidase MepM/ murein hydrolase activator NlpD
VQAGDILGRAGSSGRATGPHLHFEVMVDGQPTGPATFAFKPTTQVADSHGGGTREHLTSQSASMHDPTAP